MTGFRTTRLALCTLLALAASCGEAESFDVLAPTPEAYEEPEAMQRLRARQLIRYTDSRLPEGERDVVAQYRPVPVVQIPPTSAGTIDPAVQLRYAFTDGSPLHSLTSAIGDECQHLAWREQNAIEGEHTPQVGEYAQCPGFDGPGGFCGALTCWMKVFVCNENRLLEIASTNSPITIRTWSESEPRTPDGELVIPPQSREARAALRELTAYYGSYLGIAFTQWKRYLSAVPNGAAQVAGCGDTLDEGTPDERIAAVDVANVLREQFRLTFETSQAVWSDYVALADAEASRRTSFAEGAEAVRTIRLHAAHLLTGGLNIAGQHAGLCTTPQLSSGARRAREILRAVGLKPADLRLANDDAKLIQLMDGTLVGANGRGIRPRLARIWARPEYATMSVNGLLLDLGVTLDDFADARDQILAEIDAFGRSETLALADYVIPGTPIGEDGSLYAATHARPTVAPWSFAASRSRALPMPNALPQVSFEVGGGTFGAARRTPAHTLTSSSAAILMWSQATAMMFKDIFDATGNAALGAPLASLLDDMHHELEGMIAIGGVRDASTIEISVASDALGSQLALTTSIEGLRCAVDGAIEGQGCNWSNVASVAPSATPETTAAVRLAFAATLNKADDDLIPTTPAAFGADIGQPEDLFQAVNWSNGSTWTLPSSTRKIFIVRLRAGAQPEQPGSYEPFGAAVIWPNPTPEADDPGYYDIIPITPAIDREAARILEPSPDWCTQPQVTCSGIAYDARLPLENELNEDGGQYENSWHSYLVAAENAAALADALGEESLSAYLDIDQRSEAAVQEIEDICGVNVDLDPIRTAIDGDADDPVSAAGAQDLAACLSPASNTMVSLGGKDLCAWRPLVDEDGAGPETTVVEGALCAQAPGAPEPDVECPRVRTSEEVLSGCRLPASGTGTQYVAVTITEHLGFFTPPVASGGSGDDGTDEGTCDAIRELRQWARTPGAATNIDASRVTQLWRQAFRDDSFFETSNLAGVASSIRWEASVGNYSTVYAGNVPLLTNGTLDEGPAETGVCDVHHLLADPAPGCPLNVDYYTNPELADGAPLACARYRCASSGLPGDYPRTGMNARWARAATVARWLAGLDLSGFVVPDSEDRLPGGAALDGIIGRSGYVLRQYSVSAQEGGTEPQRYYCPTGFADPSTTTAEFYGRFVWNWGLDEADLTHYPNCATGPLIRFTPLGAGSYGPLDVSDDRRIAHEMRAAIFTRRLRENELLVNGTTSVNSITSNPLGLLFMRGSGRATVVFTDCAVRGDCLDSEAVLPYPWLPLVASEDQPSLNEYTKRGGVMFYTRHFGDRQIPDVALFDALELLCEASSSRNRLSGLDPASVVAEWQIPVAAAQVAEAAEALEGMGELIVLEGLPRDVVSAIRRGNTVTPSSLAGDYGVQVSTLRSSIAEFSATPPEIQDALVGIARAMRVANANLEILHLQRDIQRTEMMSTLRTNAISCATGLVAASGFSITDPAGSGAKMAAAALECVNLIQQSVAQMRVYGLQGKIKSQEEILAIAAFETSLNGEQAKLRSAALRLEQASNQVRASLGALESIRVRGRRALSNALFLDSDEAGRTFRSNTILRRRLNTTQQRYESSRDRAIQYAFLAKRAIEQRFGVRLADINQRMTLVDAPATWEASLCTLDGINPARIRDSGVEDEDYAGEYIGSYVQKLRDFVTSYSSDYPFTNGVDTAVISVRDDIANVRDRCTVPVGNLLYHSNDPGRIEDESGFGWTRFNCVVDENDNALPNCTNVRAVPAFYTTAVLDDAGEPVEEGGEPVMRVVTDVPVAIDATLAMPRPVRIQFGATAESCVEEDSCGWQQGVGHGQEVPIVGGAYRVSWYGRTNGGAHAVAVWLNESNTTHGEGALGTVRSVPANETWSRFWLDFEVFSSQTARVFVRPTTETPGSTVDIAGVSFTRTGDAASLVDATSAPGAFSATGATRETVANVCEDTDGDVFRRSSWTKSCARLCNSGFSGGCSPTNSTEYCYWETSFTLSEEAIDRGEMLAASGFARGNFNYRVESVGVNFVGTGARTCADNSLPSTCYSAGFIPYTLAHRGPHFVRNTFGETYEASLFPGVMEHARGLATERYLTNPVSSADSALIQPYVQNTLRGRPLDGTYTIRVWEEPGVNFEGIEDVQILLNYRYWTRSR